MPSSSQHSVLHHLQRFLFLQKRKVKGPILLAVSGGPDSVAMLHAMRQLVEKETLHIAHYNHRLRADASEADAKYVQSLSEQYSLYFHLGHSEQLSPQQTGIESRARHLRYQWLTEVAQQNGCNWVMTGHTLNDQAETVLHHLIRGTGWRGLRGIAPKRYLLKTEWEIRLIRPMLACSREDILDYLAKHNLIPRHDASNDDLRFTRNRIRHQIMPQLISLNSDAVPHLAYWAKIARLQYDQIKQSACMLSSQIIILQAKNQIAIPNELLSQTNDVMLQELLRLMWRKLRWPLDQMNYKRWCEAMEVCRGARTAVELPGRIMVRSKDLVIQFIKR